MGALKIEFIHRGECRGVGLFESIPGFKVGSSCRVRKHLGKRSTICWRCVKSEELKIEPLCYLVNFRESELLLPFVKYEVAHPVTGIEVFGTRYYISRSPALKQDVLPRGQ